MTPSEQSIFKAGLETSLLINRITLFTAKLLREYRGSGFTYLSGALTTVMLFAVTVVVFAAINLAVFKIDPKAFETPAEPTWFTFFHYSFETMFFPYIHELVPIDMASYSINMMQKIYFIFLIPIFASQIIVVQRQRFT